jgi:hypothetical protein
VAQASELVMPAGAIPAGGEDEIDAAPDYATKHANALW